VTCQNKCALCRGGGLTAERKKNLTTHRGCGSFSIVMPTDSCRDLLWPAACRNRQDNF
jgi:hypothetical protein